jgi:hypothetical protein
MSLLPATSHANPVTPFWVSASSASEIPKMKFGTGDAITYNFPDTNELLFFTYTDSSPPVVAGQYSINVTYNFRSLSTSAPTTVQGGVRSLTGTTMNSITYLTSAAGEDVAGSVVMTWTYAPGDIPTFDLFAQVSDDNGTSASVTSGWTIVFYPNL